MWYLCRSPQIGALMFAVEVVLRRCMPDVRPVYARCVPGVCPVYARCMPGVRPVCARFMPGLPVHRFNYLLEVTLLLTRVDIRSSVSFEGRLVDRHKSER